MQLVHSIEELIELTSNHKENPKDIEEIICKSTNKPGCIRCKLCGGYSGSARIIQHYFGCKYQKVNGPYIYEGTSYIEDNNMINFIQYDSIGILQREYGQLTSDDSTKIMGTYGAGPCVILCMRDSSSLRTTLAHIDNQTINYFEPFDNYDPLSSDVYIIGGDTSSRDLVNEILLTLHSMNYNITFAHVIDNNSNSFAINSLTGETFLNCLSSTDLPLVYDSDLRNERMKFLPFGKTSLNNINNNSFTHLPNIITDNQERPHSLPLINNDSFVDMVSNKTSPSPYRRRSELQFGQEDLQELHEKEKLQELRQQKIKSRANEEQKRKKISDRRQRRIITRKKLPKHNKRPRSKKKKK